MFKHAIVRTPCRALVDGLTTADLGRPDYDRAMAQHAAYVEALGRCDISVTVLPPDESFPDSCFIEDTALCTPQCAILTRPGAPSRLGEPAGVATELLRFFNTVERVEAPGTVDGGDIMMVGDHFWIGLSERTNAEGARQIIEILDRFGLTGETITIDAVLHLKTGLAYLEKNNLLATGDFVSRAEFKRHNLISVPEEEAYAANCIWVNGRVIMADGYPTTTECIAGLGYEVLTVDTSEFCKLDGGVSCLSLRF